MGETITLDDKTSDENRYQEAINARINEKTKMQFELWKRSIRRLLGFGVEKKNFITSIITAILIVLIVLKAINPANRLFPPHLSINQDYMWVAYFIMFLLILALSDIVYN